MDDWTTISRIGFRGHARDKGIHALSKLYGNKWRVAHQFPDKVLNKDTALELYVKSYVAFFRSNPERLKWLVNTASDIYDNDTSNVNSGLDFRVQETPATHLQDIAIRNAVSQLGETFQGDHLVQIRGRLSEGYMLQPGYVPFVKPSLIVRPHRKGGWRDNSIEDFWQSNKVLQLENEYLRRLTEDDELVPPGASYQIGKHELESMLVLFCTFQSPRPTLYAIAESIGKDTLPKEHYVIFNFPYQSGRYVSKKEFYETIKDDPLIDLVQREPNKIKPNARNLKQFVTGDIKYLIN